jgi:hypothetical protein
MKNDSDHHERRRGRRHAAFKGKLSEGEMRDVVKFIRVELQKMPAPAAQRADRV